MTLSIQSVTYSGLHTRPNRALRRGATHASKSAVKFSVLAPHRSISGSQDDDDGCSSVIYGTTETQWMNGCYMDLRMRSNSLLNAEASHALHQHFDHHQDEETTEDNIISMYNEIVNQHSSSQPSQGRSYTISGLIVFDKSMLGQLEGRSFTEQYGHIENGFNCGVTSFMDEPFC